MKIVVLDGYTSNPGDLDWDGFEQLGEVTVYDRTYPDEIIERSIKAEIVLTNKTMLTDEIMAKLPNLKYIGMFSTGTNAVDLEAARHRGIIVTNIPEYSTASVAQLVFALLLELCMHVDIHNKAVHEGEWVASTDFCFTKAPLVELAGKTIGIVGYGSIGRQVAKIASALGMKVVAVSRSQKEENSIEGFRWLKLPELLAQADVVSIHCPLTPDTKGMINKEALKLMKPTAFLINTSRGPVLDEAAVAEALNTGVIAGAGLDVLSTEPPSALNPLLSAQKCLITPHIAWATYDARARLMEIAVNNVRAYIEHRAENVVS